MKSNSIYVSCPISIPVAELQRVLDRLERIGFNDTSITHWKRQSVYDKSMVRDANSIVVILPDFKWTNSLELPTGVRQELTTALALNKKIFLAYKNMYGEINFYEITIGKTPQGILTIRGKEGSAHTFVGIIQDLEDENLKNKYEEIGEAEITQSICRYFEPSSEPKENNVNNFDKSRILLIKM